MKKTRNVVYVNNRVLGHFDENVYQSYSQDEKNERFKQLKNEIIKKDTRRKKTSFCVGSILLLVAITIALLMIFKVMTLGTGQWFNYTFLLVFLVFLWVLFYYLLGFIFYRKIAINFYFKSQKSNHPNSCERYASSRYYKFVEQYSQYLSMTNFTKLKENKKKKELVSFGLRNPSTFKNLIFNGHLALNVPYFYLSEKNQKILFLPGLICYIAGKKSDVFSNEDLIVKLEKNTVELYKKDELITRFDCECEFNINFFYFKYEQM